MIKVFDDFIPKYHQECILNQCNNINWKHSDNVSGIKYDIDLENIPLATDQTGYYYNIYSSEYKEKDDLLLGLCLPIIALTKTFINGQVVLERVRAGKFIKTKNFGIHRPHTDYFTNHYTLLYYVNNSDGDTFLFNQIAETSNPVYPDKMTLKNRISPKMGRAVLFDGLIYHSSSSPIINDERIAININLMQKY